MTILCDGCNVNPGWEHRCHRKNAFVRGERTSESCECHECWLSEQLFSNCGRDSHKWEKIGTWDGINTENQKISGAILKCNICDKKVNLTHEEWNNFKIVKGI